MESSYCQQAVTFLFIFYFYVFNLQLAWPPHSLACSTAPVPGPLSNIVAQVSKAMNSETNQTRNRNSLLPQPERKKQWNKNFSSGTASFFFLPRYRHFEIKRLQHRCRLFEAITKRCVVFYPLQLYAWANRSCQ